MIDSSFVVSIQSFVFPFERNSELGITFMILSGFEWDKAQWEGDDQEVKHSFLIVSKG